MPLKTIGKQLLKDRSWTGVSRRLKAMGLVVPPEIIAERKLIGRIKEGDTPPNKGKKQSDYMTKEAIERTAATRFKKGQQPLNTKYDHCIVVRKDNDHDYPYKYIRISKGKWVLYQRFVWELVNGKIPPKHIVIFRDGDSMNCDIENLELISMAENATRNNPNINLTDEAVARFICTKSRVVDKEMKQEIMQHHPELITAKRTQLLIKRKIKQYGTEQNSRP